MTQYPDLFAALAASFDPQEVRVRTQANRQIQYITARTAMNRLDTVLGPENWSDDYVPGENSVLCRLTITLPDGKQLMKADAGGYAGMPDQGDDDKSGYSDAFKRAAVKFGVGRYLYRDGIPTFTTNDGEVVHPAPIAPVSSPAPAAPQPRQAPAPAQHQQHQQQQQERQPAPAQGSNGNGNGKQYSGPPRSGRALFAWTKEQEQVHEVGLLKYINSWAKLQDFPGRMVDWDADQVAQAYAESVRKLQSVSVGRGDADEDALAN